MEESKATQVRDEGFALFTVLCVIALLSALALMGYFLAQYTSADAIRSRTLNQAYQVASSGLDRTLADMDLVGFTQQFGSGSVTGGTYVYALSSTGSTHYTLDVTGTATFGTKSQTSHVAVDFIAMKLWDMDIGVGAGNGTSGSNGNSAFQGQSVIAGPMYVHGDFQMGTSNQSVYDGGASRGPLYIYGNVIQLGGGTTNPFDLYCNGTVNGTLPTGSNRYFDVPNMYLPTIPTNMKQMAELQSADGKLGDTTTTPQGWNLENSPYSATLAPNADPNHYKVVNGGLTINSGTTPWGHYAAPSFEDSRTLHDDFAYDGRGNLYVEGTVYIDGNLDVETPIIYRGNGTLYVTGQVFFNADFKPPGAYTTTYFDPVPVGACCSTACVGIVSPRSSTGPNDATIQVNTSVVHAPLFTNGIFAVLHQGNESGFYGAVLANGLQVGLGGGSGTNALLVMDGTLNSDATLPQAMPGRNGAFVSITHWRRSK